MSFIDTYNMVFASHVLDSAGKGGNRALITFVVVFSSGFACDLVLQMFPVTPSSEQIRPLQVFS